MFRPMRRARQALSEQACHEILQNGTSGVLAVSGDDGYPYTVPLSYVCDGGVIYFHCAKSGHKLDAARRCGKASFCVIGQDQVVAEEYTSYFRSVIVFGQLQELTDPAQMRTAIELLARKYAPDDTPQARQAAIDREWNALCILALHVEHMTGKQARELMQP